MKIEKLKNSEVPGKKGSLNKSSDELNQKIKIDSAAIDVVNSIEVSEDNEDGGQFKEEESKYVHGGSVKQNSFAKGTSTVSTPPPIEQMIQQTVEAIEKELREEEGEMKELIKNKKSDVYEINNKVIRIRFLNGLLIKLKRAAKLTEDFIVGLWKQYVKKMG